MAYYSIMTIIDHDRMITTGTVVLWRRVSLCHHPEHTTLGDTTMTGVTGMWGEGRVGHHFPVGLQLIYVFLTRIFIWRLICI